MRQSILKSMLLVLLLSIVIPALAQRNKADTKAEATKKEEKKEHYLDKVSLSGLKFRSVGPALTSGRIADVAVHPENSSVYYVASASGGVWKTENNGTTFEPIFDGQGSYSIGCVTIDPNNPNIVWVGTGENNNQRSVAYGDGVYKSEDGGKSWKNVGLKESEHIGKIVVDPRNSDVVFVAAYGPLWSAGGDRGIYKTSDGGKTWGQVLKIDEHTGVNDIIIDPRNPDVMYAAAHQRRRHVFTYVGGGPESGVYRSKDGGKTWEKANRGLPAGKMGRVGLAIAPSDPEILYAIVEAEGNSGGFFASTDRAATWEKRGSHNTSGNYYSEIVVHPTNSEMIISMDVFNQFSKDGGRTWGRWSEEFKHWDNHCLWIDPKNPDHYLAGCDGGLYESFDAAKTWNFKENLPVTQFYKVAVDNSEPFYYIYGGTQDNYSLGGPSRTISSHGIMNADWFVTQGGDGFESQVDPNNPNIVYAQSQHGNLVRFDRASGESMDIQPQPSKGEDNFRWNWDAPLTISAHHPTRLYFAANKLFKTDNRGDSWQAISPDLTRQMDRNKLPVMGRVQSIDAVAKNQSTSEYGNIVAFSESPLKENLLYVGTDDGLIQVTEDGGKTWRKIESEKISGVPERCYVNYLLASQHDENVVYVAFNNHKDGNFKPYVYKSTDKGRTWTSITSNLPERGSTYSLAEDHVDRDLLFVGTEFSCFVTVDGGKYWKKLSAGLPTIAVRDMAIQKRENDLVLGTFGRGFYVLDDYSPLRQMKEQQLQAAAQIFPIKDGLLYLESTLLGTLGGKKGFQGHTMYAAENPEIGVTFTYFVKEGVKTLKQKRQEDEQAKIKKGEAIRYPTYEELKAEESEEASYLLFTIRDMSGNIVRKLKTSVRTGVNRIVWDGRTPSLSPVRVGGAGGGGFGGGGGNSGIMVMPGDYTVSLSQSINGEIKELVAPIQFKINSLGGVTLPASDRKALVEFQKEAQELQRVIAGANTMLGDINTRVRAMRMALDAVALPPTELTSDLKKIEDKLEKINLVMSGDRIASRVDMPTKPGVNNRLGTLFGAAGSTSAPTQAQKDALKIAKEEFAPIVSEIRNIMETDIKNLERKLEDAGAPYTPGRMVEIGKQ
ncbi:MAG: glycosyl hydrolase [Saprospiraceae bacterium]|nr:glycosyl hydrolase [Saprospiraceae bacterium]